MSLLNYFCQKTNLDSVVDVVPITQLLSEIRNNNGYFTNLSLIKVWKLKDYDKMKLVISELEKRMYFYINKSKIQPLLYYMIDVSLEEGDTEMTFFLIDNFHVMPSKYAIQMSNYNGHKILSKTVDSICIPRNNVCIHNVYPFYQV